LYYFEVLITLIIVYDAENEERWRFDCKNKPSAKRTAGLDKGVPHIKR